VRLGFPGRIIDSLIDLGRSRFHVTSGRSYWTLKFNSPLVQKELNHMLSDPQTITVNAVAKAMPRIQTTGTSAVYSLSDETFKLEVSHQKIAKGKTASRIRSLVRFTQRAIVPDPLTAVNDYETTSIQIVIDRPEVGFTATQLDQMSAGLKTWLDTTMMGKLFGQES